MLNFRVLIPVFIERVLKLLMLFYKIGILRTTPSSSQIARVVAHLRVCQAEGTLVIPLWKSSYFWPLLCDDGRHWNTFVHDWVVLPKFKQLFVRGKAKNDLFGARQLSFKVVALRINFKLSERISLSGFCTDDTGCCSKGH